MWFSVVLSVNVCQICLHILDGSHDTRGARYSCLALSPQISIHENLDAKMTPFSSSFSCRNKIGSGRINFTAHSITKKFWWYRYWKQWYFFTEYMKSTASAMIPLTGQYIVISDPSGRRLVAIWRMCECMCKCMCECMCECVCIAFVTANAQETQIGLDSTLYNQIFIQIQIFQYFISFIKLGSNIAGEMVWEKKIYRRWVHQFRWIRGQIH